MKKVVIIGAGLAGLSLATELADENYEVVVLEKETYLGGRASNTIDTKTKDAVPIGPHVFLSRYSNFFNFLEKIDAPKNIEFDEKILIEFFHNQKNYKFKINKKLGKFYFLPWILNHPLLSIQDKLNASLVAIKIFFLSEKSIENLDSQTAYGYLEKNGISQNAINMVYRFIGLSLINIPLEICSASEFAWMFKKWMTHSPLYFGYATVGLGDLYTHHAKKYLESKNGKVLNETSVEKIVFKDGLISHLEIKTKGKSEKLSGDLYVSTCTPIDLRDLLPSELRFTQYFSHLNAYEGVPYFSINLWFDRKITEKKFWALLPASQNPTVMNTDFYDQSNIYTTNKNYSYITSNVIYSKPYSSMSNEEIINKTLSELKNTFPKMQAKLVHARVNRIPYVIYAPYPGMRKHKLANQTPIDNFFVSGDWTMKKTQCMETAVISGYTCAENILKKYDKEKKLLSKDSI